MDIYLYTITYIVPYDIHTVHNKDEIIKCINEAILHSFSNTEVHNANMAVFVVAHEARVLVGTPKTLFMSCCMISQHNIYFILLFHFVN